ncbi:GNAT family N-acetyltransferase [Desulfovibrio sp. JY]|nr:GNAT family N-acetyltransferase [Desulfovibrio sp. JY]
MGIDYRISTHMERNGNNTVNFNSAEIIEAHVIHDDAIEVAYRLRHKVFAEELGWVHQSKQRLERDAYDKGAEHFGVFRGEKLLSYLRLVSPPCYMLDTDFSNLVSTKHKLRKMNDTREVSRLCVSMDERDTKVNTAIGSVGVSMLLYRCVYRRCVEINVRYLYLVVEYKVFRLLKMFGFPCKCVGEPTRMPDGVIAVAAIMDWREFEDTNERKRPDFMVWFNQYRVHQDVLPPQQPVLYLQHPTFS